MSKQIFISYATKDIAVAEKVYEALDTGDFNPWIATKDIPVGAEYGEAIISGIENAEAFVLIYSEASNNSQHVLREVERAVAKRVPILVYKIEDVNPTKSMEYFLLTHQWLDASASRTEKLEELVKGISGIFGESSAEFKQKEPRATNKIKTKKKSTLSPILITIIALFTIICITAIVLAIIAFRSEMIPASLNGLDEAINSAVSDKIGEIIPNESKEETTITSASSTTSVSDTTTPITEAAITSSKLDMKVGDLVDFGTFKTHNYDSANNDEKIRWMVLNYDKEKNEALLLSEKILSVKPFDVAESGRYDTDSKGEFYERNKKDSYTPTQMTEFRGNSDWEYSNIRSWLNSDGYTVNYYSKTPVNLGTDENANGYDNQNGFLFNFSDKEKSMLCKNNIVTEANATRTDKKEIKTEDKVFLLSEYEVKKYIKDQNLKLFTSQTKSSEASDNSPYTKLYKSEKLDIYPWALRSPAENSSWEIKIVGVDQNAEISKMLSCMSGLGIRPAVKINLNSAEITTESEIYKIK